MIKTDPVIVDYNAVTPYGEGMDPCWQGLINNQTAITDIERFDARHFTSTKAATIKSLVPCQGRSLVRQLLERLKMNMNQAVPRDADLILTSLNGEIDFLEQDVLTGTKRSGASCLRVLLARTHELFNVSGQGMLVSAACASSGIAVARAAALIQSEKSDCVLIVSCDCVSEFLVSGFSSLMALDKHAARPFDKKRAGINTGEAAAYMLLMSRDRAEKEERKISGRVLGWGMSGDANHMTGPSIEGAGLTLAVERALNLGGLIAESIDSICAHGTGTVYNDAMEMKAFKTLFPRQPLATYSIKGGIGHTMGAAGLMDILVALETIKHGVLPPTVGMETVDEECLGWVKGEKVEAQGDMVLSTNSGFGGINSAVIIGAEES